MKRILGMCLGGMLVFGFLTGCSRREDSATELNIQSQGKEEIVQEILADRYDGEFVVTSMEKESGMQAFDKSYYCATAYNKEDTSKEFDIIVDNQFEVLKDNYPSILYDNNIVVYLDGLMEKWQENARISYQVIYQVSDKIWKDAYEWKEYLKESGSWVSGEVQIQADSPEDAAQLTCDMTAEWEAEELPFMILFHYDGKKIMIENYQDIEIESYERILNKYSN